jgi:hypothetical protein
VRRNALAVFIALAMLITHPLPVIACSVGPDYYPRDHTQLLVLGRARSIDLGARTAVGYLEATVTLDVMRVFRGATPSPLRFVDRHSAFVQLNPVTEKQELRFFSGGACGTLDNDPVGKYVLIALARGEDARWHAGSLYGAIYTDQPEYATYRWLLERHGVAVPLLITGPVTDLGSFGPALAP